MRPVTSSTMQDDTWLFVVYYEGRAPFEYSSENYSASNRPKLERNDRREVTPTSHRFAYH